MTNDEKIDRMLKFYHGTKTLKDYLLEMAEWKQQQMVEKAVKWLKENTDKYVGREIEEYDMQYYGHINIDSLIDDFKQAMKEE